MVHHDCREGKDGWYFLGNEHQFEYDQVLGRKDVDSDFVENWLDSLEKMQAFCRRQAVDFLMTIAPAKGTIYLDKHPEVELARPERSIASQIFQHPKARQLPLLNLNTALASARKTGDVYSRLDSHWSDYGGWIAWIAIQDELKAMNAKLRFLDTYRTCEIYEEDSHNEMRELLGIDAPNNWTRVRFSENLQDIIVIDSHGNSATQPGSWQLDFNQIPVDVISPSAPNKIGCLVAADSTVAALSPYLNATFAHVAYRNHHVTSDGTRFDLADAVRSTQASLVLYMLTERYCVYPLHEIDHWRSLELFETGRAVASYVWPFRAPYEPLVCTGLSDLRNPNRIQLPETSRPANIVLKIVISSAGRGLAMHAFSVSGEASQKWHKLQHGDNALYVTVPSNADSNHFWLVRDPGGSECFLKSVELRAFAVD